MTRISPSSPLSVGRHRLFTLVHTHVLVSPGSQRLNFCVNTGDSQSLPSLSCDCNYSNDTLTLPSVVYRTCLPPSIHLQDVCQKHYQRVHKAANGWMHFPVSSYFSLLGWYPCVTRWCCIICCCTQCRQTIVALPGEDLHIYCIFADHCLQSKVWGKLKLPLRNKCDNFCSTEDRCQNGQA